MKVYNAFRIALRLRHAILANKILCGTYAEHDKAINKLIQAIKFTLLVPGDDIEAVASLLHMVAEKLRN
jgi:hypothetical protein